VTRTEAPTAAVPRLARRPVLVVAALAAAVHLAVATRYGWHRDEFYYVITGRHPAWGYVDQPPLTPLLARLAAELPGGVLPLRVLTVACQCGVIVLAAKLAAELGGRAKAQVITAAAVAASFVFLASATLFGTTVTDQLVWAALFVAVARALRLRTTGAWLLVGLLGGVGLENKDTVAVLLLGVVVGLVAFHREVWRTPGPWLAAGLAVLLKVPNVVWDAVHGWPDLEMARVLSERSGGPLGSLASLPVFALVLAGPPLVGLWVLGVRRLARSDHRWLLVAVATVVVVLTASGGKIYYPAPVLVALFAAGAVHVEAASIGGSRARWRWPALIGAAAVLAVVFGYPVLPIRTEDALRGVNPTNLETYGWPEFVDQVRAAAAAQPPGTPIFTSNYGEAGALTILGDGLTNPVLSAQNAYSDWGPPPGTPDTVLCACEFTPAYLARFWADVTLLAPITVPDGVHNQESNAGAAIYLLREPRGTWAQLWPSLRHYD
jgi:hypothetical protein